jgi:hypothetical protein
MSRTFVLAVLFAALITSPAAAVPVLFAGTGSYYEVVEGPITWDDARDAAATASHLERSGRLATITSQEENDFIVDNVIPNNFDGESFWIGGLQPEGSDEPAGGWQWITGEPFVYTNWRPEPAEPSDLGGEDRLELFNRIQDGTWNDLAGSNSGLSEGYVIEFARAGSGIPLPSALPATLLVIPFAAIAHRQMRRNKSSPAGAGL